MYPEYDPNEPSLGQSWANMLRGFQNPQAYQEAGKSLQNALQLTPNVTESLGRGSVAQAIGTTGDLRDIRNTVQSYLPKSVQNWSNAAEFLTNPYAKALIQTAPTTEQTLEAVPRMTAPYEGYKQHETMGEYIAPSLGYFGMKALKATKDLPIGMTIQDVTPPIEPAKVAEALRQPEKNALGFYSPLDEAVMNLQNQKGTGQQYLAQLLKTQGVKQEEVATRGLDTFLTENPKVTKTQIEEFLAENPVSIKETVLGVREPYDANRLLELEKEYAGLKEHAIDDPNFGEDKYDEMIKLMNLRDNSTVDSLYEAQGKIERLAQQAQRSGNKIKADELWKQSELLNTRAEKLDLEGLGTASPTKFGKPDFNLPNGENYREVLVQYEPKREAPKYDIRQLPEEDRTFGKYFGVYEGDNLINTWHGSGNAEDWVRGQKENYKDYGNFVNPNHFEQPNILAHMRVDDRVIDGKKTLFIQEIQSDWHQAGRKKGYATPKGKLPEGHTVSEEMNADNQPVWVVRDKKNEPVGFGDSKQESINSLRPVGVPDAPFKNTEQWAGLAMKRAMQMAAEGGYDRVAFTTGKQQADRYKLSKQISEIHLSGTDLVAYDNNGNAVIKQTGVTKDNLADYIGKEPAQKLLEQKPQGTLRSLSGIDLDVGGEGMKGFYDKILPDFINKYGKKNGLKVGKTKMRTSTDKQAAEDAKLLNDLGVSSGGPNAYEDVHYFDLTPEAKESFLKKGQPMFAVAQAMAITDEDSRREVLEKLFNSKK